MTDINTPEAVLTSTASVLTFENNGGTHVSYVTTGDHVEEGSPRRALAIDPASWLELGRPDEITVTVQPGNTLDQPVAFKPGRVARACGAIVGVIVVGVIASVLTFVAIAAVAGSIALLDSLVR